jgi:hypothetical protein
MQTHLLPYLDDRIAIVGRSGYGKSNAAKVGVEALLDQHARVCVLDPTDSWFGLRLKPNGKTAAYPVVIFGGQHADLPLTESSGETVGRAIAASSQSCVVSLADFKGEGARRRFAAAFLSALYEANREPLHLVVDEADTLAPQKPMAPQDNEVLARMQQIVRRGRIKGFVPWLITQRPAVLNKDVLSQADVLVAFNLTSSQDRDAIGGWIEGQADRADERALLATLPKLPRGTAVVWAPGHGRLDTVPFPLSATFDSGRTPKRGEKRQTTHLQPLDVGALREQIAAVETESKANNPTALKARIRQLEADLAKKPAAATAVDPERERAAYQEGLVAGRVEGFTEAMAEVDKTLADAGAQLAALRVAVDSALSIKMPATWRGGVAAKALQPPKRISLSPPVAVPKPRRQQAASGDLTGPQRTFLQSLAWWRAMGHEQPTRVQVATICGWRVTSGHIKNVAGSLKTLGLIDYPSSGTMTLTSEGAALAPEPDTSTSLVESVRAVLTGPQRQAFDALPPDGGSLSRADVAERCGWEATSGHVKNVLGSMRSLQIIDYPAQGTVARADWLA